MSKREMYNSILALSVGDATGENEMKILPPGHGGTMVGTQYKAGNVAAERGITSLDYFWPWTDDTAMAIGVFRTLSRYGTINQIELAKEFARNAKMDPQRGYGKGTARLLFNYLYDVENWQQLSSSGWAAQDGTLTGSKGNGSAMRDSIIGPFFGRDYQRIATEATYSAEVTHYHPEAIHGSIAVAVAAAVATYEPKPIQEFWYYLNLYVPTGEMKSRILAVAGMEDQTNWKVIGAVGNGSSVFAVDTVPFALWLSHQVLAKGMSFEQAMKSIIEVGGDTDTVAAMVGGIVGNKVTIPQEMIDRTERLPSDITP